jgi:thymidylate kinase
MDIDPEVGFKRAMDQARKLDRIECRPIEFFHKVRDGYLTLVKEDTTGRFRIIDAERPLPEVRAQFITHLVAEGIMHPDDVDWIKGKFDVAS